MSRPPAFSVLGSDALRELLTAVRHPGSSDSSSSLSINVVPDEAAPEPKVASPNDAQGPTLHIFIDYSNFAIGLTQHIKTLRARAQRTTPEAHVRVFCDYVELFDLLARGVAAHETKPVAARSFANYGHGDRSPLLYAPRRPTVAKGVLVGSYPLSERDNVAVARATQAGYSVKLLHRVQRPVEPAARPAAEPSSDPAPRTYAEAAGENVPRLVTTEQAVDEVLSLTMCESLLDFGEPGVLLLVSGDGQPGEFDVSGFVRHVQRALMRGWVVELWSWRGQLSRRYLDLFGRHSNFAVVLLDSVVDGFVRLV